jgi:hypothetical protein
VAERERAEVNALIAKVNSHRRRLRELQSELKSLQYRIGRGLGAKDVPPDRKSSRKR